MAATPKTVLEYLTDAQHELLPDEVRPAWDGLSSFLPYLNHITFQGDPEFVVLSETDQVYICRAFELALGPDIFAVRVGSGRVIDDNLIRGPPGVPIPDVMTQLAARVQAKAAVAKVWDVERDGFGFFSYTPGLTSEFPDKVIDDNPEEWERVKADNTTIVEENMTGPQRHLLGDRPVKSVVNVDLLRRGQSSCIQCNGAHIGSDRPTTFFKHCSSKKHNEAIGRQPSPFQVMAYVEWDARNRKFSWAVVTHPNGRPFIYPNYPGPRQEGARQELETPQPKRLRRTEAESENTGALVESPSQGPVPQAGPASPQRLKTAEEFASLMWRVMGPLKN